MTDSYSRRRSRWALARLVLVLVCVASIICHPLWPELSHFLAGFVAGGTFGCLLCVPAPKGEP